MQTNSRYFKFLVVYNLRLSHNLEVLYWVISFFLHLFILRERERERRGREKVQGRGREERQRISSRFHAISPDVGLDPKMLGTF